jgi:transposase-like protein
METKRVIKPVIRYSEAFKIKVVRELESEGVPVAALQARYGINGCGTVAVWVQKYGNGSRGKVIRVETPEEINEAKQLKQRVKLLEKLLADANIKLMLEEGYTQIACERAGITDVAGFKKKHPGGQRT